jgi:peptide-methionine (S)-S-oxide reductase
VGYAGGAKPNPTYYSLGDHSETIQIDYDPSQISYEDLLEVFWNSHDPTSRPYSRQYMSIIFTHNAEQERLARETMEREAARRGKAITTQIVPFSGFTLAETCHQKYHLQQQIAIMDEFRAMYPGNGWIDSTAAARANGYLGGNGSLEWLREELESLGLTPEVGDRLLTIAERLQ